MAWGSDARCVVSVGYIRRTLLPDGYFHVWIRGDPELAPFLMPDDRTAALARKKFG